ncbi:MAG TPA: hypothetical protein DCW68_07340 [Rhodospirillaceae bacterium]|nr:MAG: hypothetical protein A2018_06850 [Alphaproteobacteria bacterium GWF2_58_20]HAU29900.1 hypothetical protein [Rhodospirillaceae bacterium]
MLRFLEKGLDLLVALLAFLAGRREALRKGEADGLERDDRAARVRDRLSADSVYARRMRERFRRR